MTPCSDTRLLSFFPGSGVGLRKTTSPAPGYPGSSPAPTRGPDRGNTVMASSDPLLQPYRLGI